MYGTGEGYSLPTPLFLYTPLPPTPHPLSPPPCLLLYSMWLCVVPWALGSRGSMARACMHACMLPPAAPVVNGRAARLRMHVDTWGTGLRLLSGSMRVAMHCMLAALASNSLTHASSPVCCLPTSPHLLDRSPPGSSPYFCSPPFPPHSFCPRLPPCLPVALQGLSMGDLTLRRPSSINSMSDEEEGDTPPHAHS